MLHPTLIEKHALNDEMPILITGQTGTGKSHLADMLHKNSRRRLHPFVRVLCRKNCSIKGLELELFGLEETVSPQTGSTESGKLEQADGGTLLLENLDELSLRIQEKLFRFVHSESFLRVNGESEVFSNVRLFATIRNDPEAMILRGRLHKDFYMALNQVRIHLLPVYEQHTCGEPLMETLLSKLSQKMKKNINGFTPEVLQFLKYYPWPGNIRQLQNILERAVILEDSLWVTTENLWVPEL